MWPLIIVGAGALLIKKIAENWDWDYDDISELPTCPGVYIMYNRQGDIIHIGHTGDLYDRLSKHSKRHKMHCFDWQECNTKKTAYTLEMSLHEKHGYEGR
jgi:excinuclease UvrABC nuclease subunit